jgi:hypothetical protein
MWMSPTEADGIKAPLLLQDTLATPPNPHGCYRRVPRSREAAKLPIVVCCVPRENLTKASEHG